MKVFRVSVGLMILASVSGCFPRTYTYSVGHDIPAEAVTKITKGTTTTAQLVQLLGEPYGKQVVSDTDEKWIYMYQVGESTSKGLGKVESEGHKKMLDILVRGGVVTNFAYTEGPVEIQQGAQ